MKFPESELNWFIQDLLFSGGSTSISSDEADAFARWGFEQAKEMMLEKVEKLEGRNNEKLGTVDIETTSENYQGYLTGYDDSIQALKREFSVSKETDSAKSGLESELQTTNDSASKDAGVAKE